MKKSNKIKFIVSSAVIAAIYVVLTMFINAFNLANGAIQVRISEALTILPCFTISAIPGLYVGCLLANIITGCALPDIVFGSFATLIGAVGTYFLRKNKYIAIIPPIISNMIIVPLVLKLAYGLSEGYLYLVATIGIGEILSCGVLGLVLHGFLSTGNMYKNIFK